MQRPTLDDLFARALENHQSGRLSEAERGYRQVLRHDANHADSLHLLGIIGLQTGHFPQAEQLVRLALALRPDAALYRNTLGQILERLGRSDEAHAAYRAAIELDPRDAEPLNNLGHLLIGQDRLAEAEACLRAAIALNPRYAEPHTNLGNVHKERGELDEALASYRNAIALRPDLALLHSNLLLTLHYHPGYSAEDLLQEHRAWAKRHVAPLASTRRPHPNDRTRDRRLRIGYVSPDFREHSVARFMLPLLEQHDRRRVEIFAYSDVTRPDAVTERLRSRTDAWRDIAASSDAQVAELVRADRIDILVDLAAHTGRNRLLVFARKPAPVQVTYLGYCSTTGVDAIDFRLTDRFLDPPDANLGNYTERSIFLPDCYWCYSAPPLPSTQHAPLDRRANTPTFGCLNNFAKATRPTLELWARVMARVPEARLLLHAPAGSHRDRVRTALREAGVSENRLAFVGRQPLEDYFLTYREIDVALDTFPFGGGTTTCDALWMGVPVVTLVGPTAVSRAGSSLLSNVGLSELVARTGDRYVDIAADLMRDRPRLERMRRELRERVESSPLMDLPRFSGNLEAAFRSMWHAWCDKELDADVEKP